MHNCLPVLPSYDTCACILFVCPHIFLSNPLLTKVDHYTLGFVWPFVQFGLSFGLSVLVRVGVACALVRKALDCVDAC